MLHKRNLVSLLAEYPDVAEELTITAQKRLVHGGSEAKIHAAVPGAGGIAPKDNRLSTMKKDEATVAPAPTSASAAPGPSAHATIPVEQRGPNPFAKPKAKTKAVGSPSGGSGASVVGVDINPFAQGRQRTKTVATVSKKDLLSPLQQARGPPQRDSGPPSADTVTPPSAGTVTPLLADTDALLDTQQLDMLKQHIDTTLLKVTTDLVSHIRELKTEVLSNHGGKQAPATG